MFFHENFSLRRINNYKINNDPLGNYFIALDSNKNNGIVIIKHTTNQGCKMLSTLTCSNSSSNQITTVTESLTSSILLSTEFILLGLLVIEQNQLGHFLPDHRSAVLNVPHFAYMKLTNV